MDHQEVRDFQGGHGYKWIIWISGANGSSEIAGSEVVDHGAGVQVEHLGTNGSSRSKWYMDHQRSAGSVEHLVKWIIRSTDQWNIWCKWSSGQDQVEHLDHSSANGHQEVQDLKW
jgi:hypothetical protein